MDGQESLLTPSQEPVVYAMWERQRVTICVDCKNKDIYETECGESDYPTYCLVQPDGAKFYLDAPD